MVDGTIKFPQLTIAFDELQAAEEDYLQKRRTDEFIKGWIFGSLSDKQDKAVHQLDTAATQVWLVLENLYRKVPLFFHSSNILVH